MSSTKKFDFANLPEEFRETFVHALNQIRQFGDAIHIAEFSFLVTGSLFLDDYGDEEKNSKVLQSRDFIYDWFDNNQGFVNNRIRDIHNKREEYIQSLYAQGVIYLWTSLESFIKALMVELIRLDKVFLTNSAFEKINIPVAEYFKLKEEDKSEYLMDVIYSSLPCGRKLGIDKFECYLTAFGAGGPFDAKLKENLFYLHQIRNCIVHSDSVADKKFCENCVRLGYKVGDKITVDQDDYRVYEASVLAYMGEVFHRINKLLGAPDDFLSLIREKLDIVLNESKDAT